MTGWEQAAHIMMVAGSAANVHGQHTQAKYMRQARTDTIAENLKIRKKVEAAEAQKKEGVQEQQTSVNLLKDLFAQGDQGGGGQMTTLDRLKINTSGVA